MFNLPIKIIAQENSFDTNYPTIIMLSGQGSSGKSTFQQTYLQNIKTISIDDITREENNWEQCLKKFYIQIQQQTNTIEKQDIVLDYSHDAVNTRVKSIKHIISPFNYNFVIIHLIPDFDILIENDKNRRQVMFLSKEHIEKMKNIYEAYQQPSLEEFRQYNFKSVTIAEYRQERTRYK